MATQLSQGGRNAHIKEHDDAAAHDQGGHRHPHTTPEKVEGGVEEPATIPIPRDTLERLIALRMKQYDRQPTREVKQATDTLKRLLERENNDRIAATV